MDFFRKSGTLYNLIILIVFLLFTRYPVNDTFINENHKKGDIIEFVQLISCSVEYINPNVDRAHNQVLPINTHPLDTSCCSSLDSLLLSF